MRSAAVLSAALSAALVLTVAPAAPAEPETPTDVTASVFRPRTVGAPGAGDTYFPKHGNGGYDVRHYRITAAYRPASKRLAGKARIRAVATQRLRRFNLDLLLDVASVRVNGRTARFRQKGRELVVTPARAVRKGAKLVVSVNYGGRPADISNAGVAPFLTTRSGAIVLGQPEAAPWWFPGNDHPSDKATYDIRLRVPRGQQAIGPGRLIGRRNVGAMTQWRWVVRRPTTTYLVFAAWGRFKVVKTRKAGVRYLYAYDRAIPKRLRKRAVRSLRRTPAVTRFLTRKLGPYPYGNLGGVVTSADLGYALETQERPVYDAGFFWAGSSLERGRNTSVVAHEVAHQWFGNSVSLRRWRDIWLNEGLASYMEWLWDESQSLASVQDVFDDWYKHASKRFWKVPIGRPGRGKIFSDQIYVRGAMTVHSLRRRIGDDKFFTLLRRWVRERRDGHGTTAQFVRLAEQVSGQQLDGFFDAWLHGRKRPPR